MGAPEPASCTAFAGTERIASGDLREVASACKTLIDAGDRRGVLIFADVTTELVELDFRGSMEDVLLRLPAAPITEVEVRCGSAKADSGSGGAGAEPAPRSPGRPKLGVVGREVTLLPRHWEWLSAQPGGASVALRKLVEQARRANAAKDRVRRAQEVTFRFMTAIAGNEAGFEEASRALFASDPRRFEEQTRAWPTDVREYATRLAADAFAVIETPAE